MDQTRKARLWGSSDHRAVIAELASETSSDQADPDALYLQGVAYFRLKDYPSAVRVLRRAVKRRPDDAHSWYYLGFSSEQLDQFPEAISAYRAAARNASPALAPLVQKRLAGLDPEYRPSPRGGQPSVPPPAGDSDSQLQSQLMYPSTEAGWLQRKRDAERLAEIEAHAAYRGEVRGAPKWLMVLVAVVALLILVSGVYVVTGGFGERGRDDQQFCQQLRDEGVPERRLPAWC
jgi:tetratricopeptide (TPR) repeat protein